MDFEAPPTPKTHVGQPWESFSGTSGGRVSPPVFMGRASGRLAGRTAFQLVVFVALFVLSLFSGFGMYHVRSSYEKRPAVKTKQSSRAQLQILNSENSVSVSPEVEFLDLANLSERAISVRPKGSSKPSLMDVFLTTPQLPIVQKDRQPANSLTLTRDGIHLDLTSGFRLSVEHLEGGKQRVHIEELTELKLRIGEGYLEPTIVEFRPSR